MNMDHPDLPLPRPTLLTAPFWQAAREHRLRIQRCDQCGKLRFYPSAGCNHCASPQFTWVDLSGRGRVYSWIVVRRTVDQAWKTRVPFVTAVIELAEQSGVLIPGLLTGVAPEQVAAGLEVEVWFEDMNADISMPRWRPARPSAGAAPATGVGV